MSFAWYGIELQYSFTVAISAFSRTMIDLCTSPQLLGTLGDASSTELVSRPDSWNASSAVNNAAPLSANKTGRDVV